MTEISTDYSTHLTAAVNSNGFIDFYELLGVPGDAGVDLINTRINDLYSRSQDNREHRHLAKRREAEVLLSLMPHCMDVLLNADNRASYDAYAVSARAGAAPTDFETFMNDVIKERQAERGGLLAVRENASSSAFASTNGAASHKNGASPNGASSNGVAGKAAFDNGVSTTAKRNAASQRVVRKSVNGAMAIAFIGVFVLCDLGLALPPVATIVASALAAFFVSLSYRRSSEVSGTRSSARQASL